jgi:hypothetical protein
VPSKATRVLFLLVVLAVVAAWALGVTRTRQARVTWERPVAVAVFVSGEADAEGVASLRARLDEIGGRLTAERDRHGGIGAGSGPPIAFEVLGPLAPERLPPTEPPDGGLVERALHAWTLWRAERAAFRAAGFDPGLADVRVHVVASAPAGSVTFAEGMGAAGGDVGVVRTAFGPAEAFHAATAVVHEALHCLGASDKYDGAGHAIAPGGLPEPDLDPRYPQRAAELMVGEVALGPASGRLPSGAEELAIGAVTAAEIGWIPSPGAAR